MGTTEDCSAETRCDTDRQRLLPDSVDYDDSTMTRTILFPILVVLKQQLLQAAMKFWAFCTTSVLLVVLVYWFYGGVLSFLLLVAAFLGFVYNIQDSLLYYPNQPAHSRYYVEPPSAFGLPAENTFVKTKDSVHINLVFIKQPPPLLSTVPTILFLHGNAGNIGHRMPNMYALYMHCKVNILLVEYRGYGKSEGSPSENGLYRDFEAAMQFLFLRKDIDQRRLVVFGRSLGGAVATRLASLPHYAQRISCVILENTFVSLPAIAACVFGLKALGQLPRWCYKNKFESKERIPSLQVPTLFLSGMADTLIPPPMMQHLFQMSGASLKRIAKLPGGTHNETWQCVGYYDAINKFLQEVEQWKTGTAMTEPVAAYSVNAPFEEARVYSL